MHLYVALRANYYFIIYLFVIKGKASVNSTLILATNSWLHLGLYFDWAVSATDILWSKSKQIKLYL